MSFFSLSSATHHTQQDPTTTTITNTNTNPTSDTNYPTDSGSWVLYSTTGATHRHRTTTAREFDLRQQPPHAHTLLAGGSLMGGGVSCQDCGNQAKKDCSHMRCRTCCKSRGFECQTHVRSTWVPAARRRERQRWISAGEEDHHRRGLDQPNTRRIRSVQDGENPNLDKPIAASTYSSSVLEEGNFPSEVTTSADFRCIKVSSIDEPEDQFAYQAAVSIGGHLFKGILYDQGPKGHFMGADASSGGSVAIPQYTGINNSLYATSGCNDYMTSTQFFHQISRD